MQNAVIFNAKAATGWGEAFRVENYRHIVLSFGTASSANLTAKIYGSIETEEPTWTSAAAVGNQYDTIQMVEDEGGTAVDGDDGFVVAGTDDVILYSVNVDGLKWLNAQVTARSAGSLTLLAKAFN
jgi:hypothetical protein